MYIGEISGCNINIVFASLCHCLRACLFLTQYLGNDILHVYNKPQVRYRLNTADLYLANTKSGGFTIEVSNLLHPTHVMVGVRVHLGTKSLEKIPSFIEVFGRTKTVFLTGERLKFIPRLASLHHQEVSEVSLLMAHVVSCKSCTCITAHIYMYIVYYACTELSSVVVVGNGRQPRMRKLYPHALNIELSSFAFHNLIESLDWCATMPWTSVLSSAEQLLLYMSEVVSEFYFSF